MYRQPTIKRSSTLVASSREIGNSSRLLVNGTCGIDEGLAAAMLSFDLMPSLFTGCNSDVSCGEDRDNSSRLLENGTYGIVLVAKIGIIALIFL